MQREKKDSPFAVFSFKPLSTINQMKKVLFLLLVLLAFGNIHAQNWKNINSNNPAAPQVNLISSSDEQIVVNFSFDGYFTNAVKTPNGKQFVVSVPKMVSMLEAGAPDLPQYAIPALIGDRAEMSVEVVDAQYTDYTGIEIAPSKGNLSRQVNPDDVPYTYGSMYSDNAFYPAAQATLESPYILRDFRGQNIMVRPFTYNPVSKTLRVYHDMTIAMNKVSDRGVNAKNNRKSNRITIDPEVKQMYNHRFINFNTSMKRYNFVEDAGEMLVICPDQYMEAMQPFVDWKNMSGRKTTMVSVANAGGNNDNQIKSYIQNIYNDQNRNLQFVLFVGDYADITPHEVGSEYSDNWFGQLEGDDHYLEVFVGRFSVENDKDVNTHVDKVLYYERDMPAGVTWINTGVGVAANEGAGSGHMGGEADYVHMDFIRDTLLHYTYKTVTQQYSGIGGGTSATAISADFNAGASIGNYCNHGSETAWAVGNFSTTDVNALTNDYKWPFIWSVACLNGKFNYESPCFGEAWMRATNNETGAPTGAIGGMFSWMSQPWTPPMTGQDEMVDILTEWKSSDKFNHTLSGASLNGSMYMMDIHGDAGIITHDTWILFGDPTLLVRTDNPVNMNAQHPEQLPIGMSSMSITADTKYGIATLSLNGEVLGSAKIINNAATLNFDPISTVGTAKLCIIGYNKVTEISDIQLIPADGPYVTVTGFAPQTLPFAQASNISIDLKNVGSDPTTGNSTITLSTENPFVTIENGSASCGAIASNETISLEDAFTVSVSDSVENNTSAVFNVKVANGQTEWTSNISLTFVKPIIEFAGYNWKKSFEPGETFPIAVSFKNKGKYMATNATIGISSTNNHVSFDSTAQLFGTIDPDGTATCIFNATINTACPTTQQIPLAFTFTSDNGIEANGTGMLKNSCNVVFTLKDSYGDGWNGGKLTVEFDDNTPSQTLTMESGKEKTYTIEIGNAVHVTVSYTKGNYPDENSFTVAYEEGETIYSSPQGLTNGVQCEFDCNCVGGSGTVLNPVSNLTISNANDQVTLNWEAPRGFQHFSIERNGVHIADTTSTTYTETVNEGSYTYCVTAVYDNGSSIPVCASITLTDIVEGSYTLNVFPNPAHNVLNISINGNSGNVTYSIYNYQGQAIISKNLGIFEGTEQISLDGLAKGIYFLRITTGAEVNIQKIIVE